MDQDRHQDFSKVYGKIRDLAMIEVSVEAIASLAQYYDQLSYPNFVRGPLFDGMQPSLDRFEELDTHR